VNELVIEKTYSSVDKSLDNSIESFSELLQILEINFGSEDGYCIAYLDYTVLIGKYQNEQLIFAIENEFDPLYLQRLRVFNLQKEFHLWRTFSRTFNTRLRVDGKEGEEIEFIDVDQLVWGSKEESLEPKNNVNFIKLFNERGMEIVLPEISSSKINKSNNNNRLFIRSRNYISYNDLYQPEYFDQRLVEFLVKSFDNKQTSGGI